MDKVVASPEAAVADIARGSSIGISGFGVIHGFPVHLIAALRERGLADPTIVCNSLGNHPSHPVTFVERGQARKLIAALSARPGGVAEPDEVQVGSPVELVVERGDDGAVLYRLRLAR